ncbi:MAG: hypothetical protein NZZ41_00515 [Candidatus Dojkabacteria bacterium]|nr:hypothetical protein [Candidatus Dojkabacteria bacterium]
MKYNNFFGLYDEKNNLLSLFSDLDISFTFNEKEEDFKNIYNKNLSLLGYFGPFVLNEMKIYKKYIDENRFLFYAKEKDEKENLIDIFKIFKNSPHVSPQLSKLFLYTFLLILTKNYYKIINQNFIDNIKIYKFFYKNTKEKEFYFEDLDTLRYNIQFIENLNIVDLKIFNNISTIFNNRRKTDDKLLIPISILKIFHDTMIFNYKNFNDEEFFNKNFCLCVLFTNNNLDLEYFKDFSIKNHKNKNEVFRINRYTFFLIDPNKKEDFLLYTKLTGETYFYDFFDFREIKKIFSVLEHY